MVGLLNAPKGTRLYHRLQAENRLVMESSGNNTDFSLNFVPKMDSDTLIKGYRQILNDIYSPAQYYQRVRTLLREYKPKTGSFSLLSWRSRFQGLMNCVWFMGFAENGRRHFWKLAALTLLKRPGSFPLLVTLSIYGYHFRRVIQQNLGPFAPAIS
jgi:hypothetical protein